MLPSCWPRENRCPKKSETLYLVDLRTFTLCWTTSLLRTSTSGRNSPRLLRKNRLPSSKLKELSSSLTKPFKINDRQLLRLRVKQKPQNCSEKQWLAHLLSLSCVALKQPEKSQLSCLRVATKFTWSRIPCSWTWLQASTRIWKKGRQSTSTNQLRLLKRTERIRTARPESGRETPTNDTPAFR